MQHPNIVKFYDFGPDEWSQYYYIMEYIEGDDIKKYVKGMDFRNITKIMLKVARALGVSHRQNVIHRDVKPSNIMVTKQGEPKLLTLVLQNLRTL